MKIRGLIKNKLFIFFIASAFICTSLSNYCSFASIKKKVSVNTSLYPATMMGKYGFINSSGKFVIEPTYDNVEDFSENAAAVTKRKKVGYIDESGHYIINPIYDEGRNFSEDLAAVRLGRSWYFIDKRGRAAFKINSDYVMDFKGGLAAVELNGKIGFVDKRGKLVISPKYTYATSFSEGFSAVSQNNKTGFINTKGTLVIQMKFSAADSFSENLAPVKLNGKWGFINTKGIFIIKPQYEMAYPFSDGLAAVQLNGKWGFIDKKNNMLLKPSFQHTLSFNEGFAVTGDTDDFDGFSIINQKGGVLRESPSGTAESFKNGLAKLTIDNRLSYINKDGQTPWTQVNKASLPIGGAIIENKLKPNDNTLIYYPQLTGMKNLKIQEKINTLIKEKFNVEQIGNEEESLFVDYTLQYNKNNILNFLIYTYTFAKGAAHGMTAKNSLVINTSNGNIYGLKDLFKANSPYVGRINTLIKDQIASHKEDFIASFNSIDPNKQEYFVSDNGISLFFQLYEYTPYAYGFPEFFIPKIKLKDIMNTGNPVWGSLK